MDTSEQKDSKPRSTIPAGLRPTPPRLTRADLRARGKLRITLTRQELEELARLVRAGKVMLNTDARVSPQLRNAMTRLGVPTWGL